jgi:isocitrate dehydrogenase kinase/phosphatase
MADTLEYSDVAFPRSRFDDDLLAELKNVAPSIVEEDEDQVIIKHLYIERRMTPLNIWLTRAEERGDEAAIEHGVREYGNAIRELVGVNIFPGDMLYKNFGVTRHGRVVFYDYDEIEYITDCNFRTIPAPRNDEDEMAAEPWYPVARNDVFPEQLGTFLLGNPSVKKYFMRHHAELLTPEFWQQRKKRIMEGIIDDVFPYPQELRFSYHHTSHVTPEAGA